jgi:hypothetical protein
MSTGSTASQTASIRITAASISRNHSAQASAWDAGQRMTNFVGPRAKSRPRLPSAWASSLARPSVSLLDLAKFSRSLQPSDIRPSCQRVRGQEGQGSMGPGDTHAGAVVAEDRQFSVAGGLAQDPGDGVPDAAAKHPLRLIAAAQPSHSSGWRSAGRTRRPFLRPGVTVLATTKRDGFGAYRILTGHGWLQRVPVRRSKPARCCE